MISRVEYEVPHMKEIKSGLFALNEAWQKMERDLRDCRNELCLRCGSYREKHLGACDGCRWKE